MLHLDLGRAGSRQFLPTETKRMSEVFDCVMYTQTMAISPVRL